MLLTKPAAPFAQSRLLCLAFHNKSELKFRIQMSLNINNSAYSMWPLDRTAPGPDALYSSRHFLAESELKSENSLWKDSTIFLHSFFRLVSFMWLWNARISSWRQVGVFCFDGFHSFMAPQITLLFLEFLYGFLCAPKNT